MPLRLIDAWIPDRAARMGAAARKALEEQGRPLAGKCWDALIAPLDRCPGKWRYLYPAPGAPAQGWQTVAFDDSTWPAATRLLIRAGWQLRAGARVEGYRSLPPPSYRRSAF